MRLEQYLQEKYLTRMKGTYSSGSFEIFVNPSTKEMREIGGIRGMGLRFTADNVNQKLYIWDADKAVHIDVWEEFSKINKGRDYYDVTCCDVIFGQAELKGGKWEMTYSDELTAGSERESFNEDVYNNSQWINKYIKVNKYLKKFL